MEFADFIKNKREEKRMSKYALGKMTGFTPQYIYHVETKRLQPSLERMEKLCRALGCEYVVGRKDKNRKEKMSK